MHAVPAQARRIKCCLKTRMQSIREAPGSKSWRPETACLGGDAGRLDDAGDVLVLVHNLCARRSVLIHHPYVRSECFCSWCSTQARQYACVHARQVSVQVEPAHLQDGRVRRRCSLQLEPSLRALLPLQGLAAMAQPACTG